MDHLALRDADSAVDLESGEGTTSEEDAGSDSISNAKQSKTLLSKVHSAFSDQSEDSEYGVNSCSNLSHFNGEKLPLENVQVLTDKNLEEQETTVLVDKVSIRDQCKKKSAKKASKPPRPPRGPSLDAADQKLIKEINELTLLKRARIERLKALKKMKATKSSSNSNLFAMVFTIMFFLIILFQGISTRSAPVGFHGSPESATGTAGNLISVQYHKNLAPKDINGPDSGSPNVIEQVSGMEPEMKVSETVGSHLESS